ncbi:MAG: glycosyltransferase family 2 protein [Xanthobacteraceae bacterium]
MKLSIVATLYRSAATVDEFYRRAMKAAEPITDDLELVLVNDGSPDDSLERALALHRADPRVVVVDLARNFGHHKAMMTGLAHARGDLVFLIDSDLEEEPELLAEFHERLAQGDCDVVYGYQQQRGGGLFGRLSGEIYYAVQGWLTDDRLPRNMMTVRLMTRDYVRALVRYRDREFLIGQLWASSGFRQVGVPARKLSHAPTTYTLQKRIEMAVKHLTTSSTRLLYLVLYLGLAIWTLSIAAIGFYLVRYFIWGISVGGFTSLIISIWFFGGLTTLILGVLGVYIANIFSETKRRPYTVIRQVYRAANLGEAKSERS